jgi:hypothetical protein
MKVCFVSMLLNLQTRSFELLFNCCYLLAIERCFQQWRPANVYHSSVVMDGYHLFTYSIGLPITSMSTVVWYLIVWQQWNASMVLKEHGLVEWFFTNKIFANSSLGPYWGLSYLLQTWLCMLWEAWVQDFAVSVCFVLYYKASFWLNVWALFICYYSKLDHHVQENKNFRLRMQLPAIAFDQRLPIPILFITGIGSVWCTCEILD